MSKSRIEELEGLLRRIAERTRSGRGIDYGTLETIEDALSQQTDPALAQDEQQPVVIPEAVRAWMMEVPLPDNEYGDRMTNRRDELIASVLAHTIKEN